MHFVMDDGILALVDSVADFFERRGDAHTIAEASARSGPAADRQRWTALCEMGLPVLRLAEPDGIGTGLLEATAVAEKIGAVLLPEPAVATMVFATAWAAHSTNEILDAVCTGSRITTLSGFDTVAVAQSGEVNGRVRITADGISDAAAVLADDEYTGESALVILNTAALPAPLSRSTVDPTRHVAVIELVGAEPAEVLRLTNAEADRIRCELVVLSAAELVGGMQRVLHDTLEFVASRRQFGRSIGSFQAIKHQLADMYTMTERARALVQLAALNCAEDADSASDVVGSMARWVPRSAIDVSEAAIQLHGAMGFSWEVDVHLHLRRALVMRAFLNDFHVRDGHRRALLAEVL